MNSTKFIEFKIKNEKLYNSLSDYNKRLISDLDFYSDLGIYTDIYYRETYLYIGKKDEYYYFIIYKYNVRTGESKVGDKIIKDKDFEKYREFGIRYIGEKKY